MRKKIIISLVLFLVAFRLNSYDVRDPLDFSDEIDLPYHLYTLLHFSPFIISLLVTDRPDEFSTDELAYGTRFHSSEGNYYQSYHANITDVFGGSSGFGWYFRDRLVVGMDFFINGLRDERIQAFGVGGCPYFRWQIYRSDNFTFFYQTGIGMIYTNKVFPPGGTRINFTPNYELGFTYKLKDKLYWIISYRHFHISNGGLISGPDHNPGFDSNGIRIGYQFLY